MSDLTPMQMLEIECKKLLAECERLGKELHASRRETIELRAAARALLAELPKAALQCRNCDDLATHCWPSPGGGVRFACDAHNVSGSAEMDHAPALRRLRALLEVKP